MLLCRSERVSNRRPRMDTFGQRNPRLWPTIVTVAILFVSVNCSKSEQSQTLPPEVEVVQVEQKDAPLLEGVGRRTLDGLVNAQIRPQVTGYLLRQNYKDGSFVKKGELMFRDRSRTFRAALDQAKGQLANAEQQLAQAEANQVKAQLDVSVGMFRSPKSRRLRTGSRQRGSGQSRRAG